MREWDINMSIHSQCSTIHIDSSNPYKIYDTKDESKSGESDGTNKRLGGNIENESESLVATWLESLKYLFSLSLLIVSIIVITISLLNNKTITTKTGVPGWTALLLFWVLIFLLPTMEGGQGCLLSHQSTLKVLYKETHPLSFKNIHLVRTGEKFNRFTVGRQCLVVVIVFLANLIVSAAKETDVIMLGIHFESVFLEYGLGIFLIITIVGQLTTQLSALDGKLDFINSYVMIMTTYVAFAVEFCGLFHAVHLARMLFSKIRGINDNEIEENTSSSKRQRIFFWARVSMSCAFIGFVCAATFDGLLNKHITLWKDAPWFATLVISVFLMAMVGVLEGIQVALFTAITKTEDELRQCDTASKNCRFVFRNQNFQAFLIGRQICVTFCMLLMINVTVMDIKADSGENILGVSNGMQDFLNSGILGAVLFTIFASLVWRAIALSYPLAFLSNPLISKIIYVCVLVERSGICSASWLLAYFHKSSSGNQHDDVYLKAEDVQRETLPTNRREKNINSLVTIVKFTYSLALLVFSVTLVMAALFTDQTVAHEMGIPTLAAFFIFWFLIIWLAMMEGGQGCLVGLQQVDKDSYIESHPISLKSTSIVHRGDNMERFIVGRQFLVVLVVFIANMMGGAVSGASVLGLPDLVNNIFLAWVDNIFLSSGLALILTTIVLGQLTAQVNATNCMLDFTNTYFMVFTTYCALAIEYSGLLHSVYLIQIIFSKLAGKPVESKEPPMTVMQKIFFWVRVIISCIILGLAFAVTISALFNKQTAMWEGVPEVASVVILFALMSLVGMLEGMQIALFAVINMPKKDMLNRSVACKNCELAFSGQNLAAFLIGRQILVTCCMFVVARITSLTVEVGTGENVFGISDNLQEFFNTGLLGAVITTIVASLAWRVIASSFPLAFLSNPLINLIIHLCLLLEKTGVCSAAWVVARYHKVISGYRPDEVHFNGNDKNTQDMATESDKNVDAAATLIKCAFSIGLLSFSIFIVSIAMLNERTRLSIDTHPAVTFVIFWLALLWLAMMEGGQACLISLQSIDQIEYIESHPITLKCTKVTNKGSNMERFILGRQFLVVVMIFLINMSGSAVEDLMVKDLMGTPKDVVSIGSVIAVMMITVVIGQLITQINGITYMLDFMNNRFMFLITLCSLVAECTGLTHSVYLIKMMFSKFVGKTAQLEKPPLTWFQSVLFWVRVIFSCAALGLSFVATVTALLEEKTTMWATVPASVSLMLMFLLIILVGIMEGAQTALFCLLKMPEEKRRLLSPWTRKVCRTAFKGESFSAFLVGRQMFVTCSMFVLARATTLSTSNKEEGSVDTEFSVMDFLQVILNRGFGGAVIISIAASLVWRSIALSFPGDFLSNPLVYFVVQFCILLEKFGVSSAWWPLAVVQKELFGFKSDDTYFSSGDSGVDVEVGVPNQ